MEAERGEREEYREEGEEEEWEEEMKEIAYPGRSPRADSGSGGV